MANKTSMEIISLKQKLSDREKEIRDLKAERDVAQMNAANRLLFNNDFLEKIQVLERSQAETHAALLETQKLAHELEWERDTLFAALRRLLDDSDE